DAAHLEQHPAGLHDRDPALRVALARAHSGLGRLLGDRLVGKHPDPDLAAALDVPGHGATSCLDLAVAHPARFDSLQAVVTEGNGGATRRDALAAAAVHLAVLDALRHQHQVFFLGAGFLAGVFFSAASVFGAAAAFVRAAGFLASSPVVSAFLVRAVLVVRARRAGASGAGPAGACA